MKFVSEQYNDRLAQLAEQLVTPARYDTEQKLGQLAIDFTVEAA